MKLYIADRPECTDFGLLKASDVFSANGVVYIKADGIMGVGGNAIAAVSGDVASFADRSRVLPHPNAVLCIDGSLSHEAIRVRKALFRMFEVPGCGSLEILDTLYAELLRIKTLIDPGEYKFAEDDPKLALQRILRVSEKTEG
jgi:hypothetical protein